MQLYDDLMRLHNLKAVHQLVLIYKVRTIVYEFAPIKGTRKAYDGTRSAQLWMVRCLAGVLGRGRPTTAPYVACYNGESSASPRPPRCTCVCTCVSPHHHRIRFTTLSLKTPTGGTRRTRLHHRCVGAWLGTVRLAHVCWQRPHGRTLKQQGAHGPKPA